MEVRNRDGVAFAFPNPPFSEKHPKSDLGPHPNSFHHITVVCISVNLSFDDVRGVRSSLYMVQESMGPRPSYCKGAGGATGPRPGKYDRLGPVYHSVGWSIVYRYGR